MSSKIILSLFLLVLINPVFSDEYVNSTIPITGSKFCSEMQLEYDIYRLNVLGDIGKHLKANGINKIPDEIIDRNNEDVDLKTIETICRIALKRSAEKHLNKLLLIEKGLLKSK